jgi:hypothetical protein
MNENDFSKNPELLNILIHTVIAKIAKYIISFRYPPWRSKNWKLKIKGEKINNTYGINVVLSRSNRYEK